MRLTPKNVHIYLLDKGFIDLQSLVTGDYLVTHGQTRNFIFRVIRKNAKSLFIKQLNNFDQTNTYVLQKDATCLWLIKNNPAFQELSHYVPEYLGFDPESQVLITEYLPGSVNLDEYVRATGVFPDGMMEELASILVSYHFTLGDELRSSPSVQFFPIQVPWVLQLGDTGSPVTAAMVAQNSNPAWNSVIGNPEFKSLLASIKTKWVVDSLIHGDMKWSNLLSHRQDDRLRVKVIDWEIADIGDPLWDVAGIFQGFVSNALFYSSGKPTEPFSLVPGVSITDLQAVWPPVRHFWKLYLEKRGEPAEQEDSQLERCISYTGARLIQSAIEQNMMSASLQPASVKLLQASYAILNNIPEIMICLQSSQLYAIA